MSEPAAEALDSEASTLPWWVGLGVLGLFGIWTLRAAAEFVVGREAAGHVLAALVIGTLRVAFGLVFWSARALVRAGAAVGRRAA